MTIIKKAVALAIITLVSFIPCYAQNIENYLINPSDNFSIQQPIGTFRFNIDGNGNITFNNAYTFPLTDGNASQILITDGAGNLSWGTLPINTVDTNTTNISLTKDNINLILTDSDSNTVTIPLADLQVVAAGATGSEPASPAIGEEFFDTTTATLMIYNGSDWVAATPTVIDTNTTYNLSKVGQNLTLTGSDGSTNNVSITDISITNTSLTEDGTNLVLTDSNTNTVTLPLNNLQVVATGATGSEPVSPAIGEEFFDTTTATLMIYNGSDWVASSPVALNSEITSFTVSGSNLVLDQNNATQNKFSIPLTSISTDDQMISISGNIISLEDGGSVTLPSFSDTDTTNVNLSVSGSNLVLTDSAGGTVSIALTDINTTNSSLTTDGSGNLILTDSDNNTVSIPLTDINTDSQQLSLNLSTNILALEDGGSVDLTPYIDIPLVADVTVLTQMIAGDTVYDQATNTLQYFNGTDWVLSGPDNLGNHTADKNINLNNNHLSGDGDSEGIYVDADGDVAIGAGSGVNSSAIFELKSTNKGAIMPRLTELQRDAIVSLTDGLFIYNTDESCFNYYNASITSWLSLCGSPPPALVTACPIDSSTVIGRYTESTATDITNHIDMPISISRSGSLSATVITENGVSFSYANEHLPIGNHVIRLHASGTPSGFVTGDFNQNDGIDDFTTINGDVTINGTLRPCNVPIDIYQLVIPRNYTMTCPLTTATNVVGTYYKDIAINPVTNYIELNVINNDLVNNVVVSISSDTLNGMQFSITSQNIAAGATETIRLSGSGTPITNGDFIFTITSDAELPVTNQACTIDVPIVLENKNILGAGGAGFNVASGASTSDYQSTFGNNRFDSLMLTTDSNFGPIATDGQTQLVQDLLFKNAANEASIINDLTGSTPPDVFQIGFDFAVSTSLAAAIDTYLNNGGSVIAYVQRTDSSQNLLREVFDDNSITTGTVGSAGSVYQFNSLPGDPILNGPFGNVGQYWGEDQSSTVYALNVPATAIVYSTADSIGFGANSIAGGITAVRHSSKNFIWVGDAGFSGSLGGTAYDSTSQTASPLAVTGADYRPASNIGYGLGSTYSVDNSFFHINAFAWALSNSTINPPGSN